MSFSWMSFCAKFLVVAVMVVVVGCCLLTFKKNQGEQTKRSKYLRRLSLAFNGRRPTQRRVVHFLFVWAKCADKESHIPAAINDTRNRGAFLQKTTPDTHMDDRQTPRHQAHKNACVVLWLQTKRVFLRSTYYYATGGLHQCIWDRLG